MPYIYKITNNINEKVYIGKTMYTIERRWHQHLDNALNRDYLWHLPLYAAMRKHGVINFIITQVEEVKDFHKLSEREQYWVAQYDSYQNGYNATRGGDGALLYDYDWIWDLWESGLTIKEIAKEVDCNDFVVRTVLTLHNISTEERKERSYYKQIESYKPYQRPVEQLDINTNKVIAEYESVSAAARAIDVDSSNLSKACKQPDTIHYGYKWRYKENVEYIKKDFSPKVICKLDLKTHKILDVYASISEAARAINGDTSYLSKVCRGIQKSSHGFGWCYLNDYI